jgi:hypothetical protein
MKQTRILLTGMVILSVQILHAQEKDTVLPSRTVNVTSTYKPVLQNASKINFNATLPAVDNKLPVLTYDIPAPSLYFSYLPAGLEPMVMQPDSQGIHQNANYVKAGFGNFTTPYAAAGFSFGNKDNMFGLYASHISSKGNIQYQNYSNTAVQLDGKFRSGNAEIYGKAGFKIDDYNQYGYDHTLYNFSSSDVAHNFQTFHAQVGVRNATSNEYGFSYDPNVDFNVFRDNRSANEINALVSVPLERRFGDNWAFRVNVAADLTAYKTDSTPGTLSNNVFYVTPVLAYHNENFTLNAGINPSWDNNDGGKFNLFPHIDASVKLTEPLSLIAGWNGYYQKNTYQYLESLNPYLDQITTQYNTEVRDFWGGIKGSAGPHITYMGKISYLTYTDLPLWVNDSITGMGFETVREEKLKIVQIHGEIGFTAPGHFSLTVMSDVNNFISEKTEHQPWEILPFTLTGKLRWQPVKDVTLKADIFTWRGPWYRDPLTKAQKTLDNAFDLNAGVEFSISKSVGLWLDCNNILNSTYQRWNQYPVLGFNILGGIVFSFGQKR